jgi:hypothetical protein
MASPDDSTKTTAGAERREAPLKDALSAAGFDVTEKVPSHPDLESELYVECCDAPVSSEAWAGNIFGPDRVWCCACGREVKRGNEVDQYV